ncbi:TPA: hypothetical protein ACH3X3_015088 [Trebouxia sp. C0006]
MGFRTVSAVFGSSGAGLSTIKAICPTGNGTSVMPQTCRFSIDSMLRPHTATGSIRIMIYTQKAMTVNNISAVNSFQKNVNAWPIGDASCINICTGKGICQMSRDGPLYIFRP